MLGISVKETHSEVLGFDELLNQEVYLDTFDMGGTPSKVHQVIIGELYVQLNYFFKDKQCKPILSPFKIDLVEKVKGLDEFTQKVLIYKFKQYNSRYKMETDEDIISRFKFIPDLSVICNWEKLDDEGSVLHDAPTLIIEVISRSTQNSDYDFKKLIYEKCGVKEYIIIDTILKASHYWDIEGEYRNCNVHASTNSNFTTDLVVNSKVFEGLKLLLKSESF